MRFKIKQQTKRKTIATWSLQCSLGCTQHTGGRFLKNQGSTKPKTETAYVSTVTATGSLTPAVYESWTSQKAPPFYSSDQKQHEHETEEREEPPESAYTQREIENLVQIAVPIARKALREIRVCEQTPTCGLVLGLGLALGVREREHEDLHHAWVSADCLDAMIDDGSLPASGRGPPRVHEQAKGEWAGAASAAVRKRCGRKPSAFRRLLCVRKCVRVRVYLR